jgi:hypothetical protein
MTARVTPERRRHIPDGNKNGGGHRHGTGIPGKSEFPADWTDEKIIRAIEDVANDPGSARLKQRNGRTKVSGTRDGIAVDVIVAPSGEIVTGYPMRVPRGS